MAVSRSVVGSFNERILQALRPNFFELLSQEAMHDALRPAFQYLIKVFARSRPDWLEGLWWCSDELYLVFEVFLQLHFIQKHDGSFSENFYSLKRVPHSRPTEILGRKDRLLSILCLAVIPYIKVKLDVIFFKFQERDDVLPLTWSRGQGLKPLAILTFFKVYPYLQSLWEAFKFIFRVLYLFKKTEYYSPLLCLSGLFLSRIMEEENDITIIKPADTFLQLFIRNLLPLGVFSLKFLEWWYSAERSTTVKMMTSLPVPPLPNTMKPHPAGVQLPSDPSLCPLCGHKQVQPTTLSSSGYIFCYHCIHDYVSKQKECPVTCLPSSKQQLIRLYLY